MVALRNDMSAGYASVSASTHAWSVEELFEQLNGAMIGHAYRQTHDYELARDLTQDVWAVMCSAQYRAKLAAMQNPLAQRGYLFRALNNKLADYFRRQRCAAAQQVTFSRLQERIGEETIEDAIAFASGHVCPQTRDVSEIVEAREEWRALSRALYASVARSPWKRAALTLWIEGRPLTEIADLLARASPTAPQYPAVKKLSCALHAVAAEYLRSQATTC